MDIEFPTPYDMDAYRFKVHLLEGHMNYMREQAELHGNWDNYYWARRKWRDARNLLYKKERQITVLTGGCILDLDSIPPLISDEEDEKEMMKERELAQAQERAQEKEAACPA